MDPISLAVGLAGLFSACIECFDYIKAAQSLEDDFHKLLVKLDFEKAKLLNWGNAIGVVKADDEGRAPELQDVAKLELVERGLECIKSLLSDVSKLQNAYGLRPLTGTDNLRERRGGLVSSNSLNLFKASEKPFWGRNGPIDRRKFGLGSKTKWAIQDKAKFERLIVDLREFIGDLNHNS
jgi:hypothetical protein